MMDDFLADSRRFSRSMPNIRCQALLILSTVSLLFKLPVTVVTVVTSLDFSGGFLAATGNRAGNWITVHVIGYRGSYRKVTADAWKIA